ncbi:MAG: NHL repeat-containing protein, partial [Candidatus Desantisbacteria bacterium]
GTNTQFVNPSGLAIDDEGKMYVIDTDNIMKLSPQGEILKTISINDPKGVAVAGNELYVTSADKILCFDSVLLNLKWSLSDHRDWNPFGIAVREGYVYVTDIKNNCICRILSRGKSTSWICSVQGGLNKPLGIAVADDCVFVTDTGNHSLWLFEKGIEKIGEFGNQGKGVGQFVSPSKIAVKGNRLYVVDTGNCRIQVFDR